MPAADEAVRRCARVLSGFMSPEIVMGFASGILVLDPASFHSAWQLQQAALPKPFPPAVANPKVEPMPAAAATHVQALKASPLFALNYGATVDIQMIELGNVLACQYWVDTHVSGGVHGAGMQATPSLDELLNTALPLSIIPPVNLMTMSTPNGMVAYSMNNTLRVEGPGFDQTTGRVTFAIGLGPNLLLIREHAGRYVLMNGYHRAWLLRSKKVTMVPAVIAHVADPKDLDLGPGFVSASVLMGPRPPTVDDFFNNSVSMDVDVRATLKAVKITAEVSDIPRMLMP